MVISQKKKIENAVAFLPVIISVYTTVGPRRCGYASNLPSLIYRMLEETRR